MARRIRHLDEVRLDVFQAVRRALLRQEGYVRRRQSHQTDQPASPSLAVSPRPAAKKTDSPKEPSGPSPAELTDSQEPQDVHEKLIDITEKAQDVIYRADTVFPFTLFPDTITLDREKLTVAKRSFFRVAKIISVPVSSISSAEVDIGPFFGSLHMASKYFVQNIYSVNFLTRFNALKLQHLLQGFIIAQEKGIDLTDIEKEDLLLLLTDLGQGVSD